MAERDPAPGQTQTAALTKQGQSRRPLPRCLRLPLSDTRSEVLALVDTTAPSWEEVPVLAGCGLARANVDGGLGCGRTWRSDCSLLAKRGSAGGRGAGRAPRPARLPYWLRVRARR